MYIAISIFLSPRLTISGFLNFQLYIDGDLALYDFGSVRRLLLS